MNTAEVEKTLYKNYLKKAREFLQTSDDELIKEKWNSAVLNAIHSGISAADSLTVFFKGIRHSGDRHGDVVKLLKELNLEDLNAKARQLLALIEVKNKTAYEETLMTKNDANDANKNAKRFLSYVEKVLRERDEKS